MGVIELGSRVRDKLSKLEGVVVSITHWLHGCTRIQFQPEGSKDGEPCKMVVVDEPQCELLGAPDEPPALPRHGDRPGVGRNPDPIR
jgi:hypothetical protein